MASNGTLPPLLQAAIQRVLPHRYPFLFVDRITEFVPGERIAGVKSFSGAEESSRGTPVVPAAVLLELVTQLGAILVLGRPEMEGKVAMILQIPSARLLEVVRTGDQVRAEAEVVRLREQWGELQGRLYHGGRLIAEGQMRFAIINAAGLFPAKAEVR